MKKVFQKTSNFTDLESRIALVGENSSGEITLVKLLTRAAFYRQLLEYTQKPHFTHHVDQLVMDTTSLELIQSRLPGEEEYRHQLVSFGISGVT